jgi:argininosuccinate synthase
MNRVVLAYSGGLDTSVAVPWLAEKHDAEVVCVTVDLGQGRELDSVRERALAAGAIRAHVLDARQEFADRYILPALQAGAVYEGSYPLATALGRPLIAKKLVEIAGIEGTPYIAHGCTGKGNDQVRIEVSVRALMPDARIVAPAREWGMTRLQEIEYARERGITVPVTAANPFSTDANLWGRSVQCGVLEDPWAEPPGDVYTLTKAAAECPDAPAYIELEFDAGVPVAVNGIAMPFMDLIASVGTIAGAHGVGRIDMIENRLVGIKSREVYEAPAAVVLYMAHRELESFVSPRDLLHMKQEMAVKYADMVYNGLWYSPVRDAMDAFVAKTQERVTGVVRVRLFKGSAHVVGRKSPNALYDRGLATYVGADDFDHGAAAGFVKVFGLPIETAARRQGQEGRPANLKKAN